MNDKPADQPVEQATEANPKVDVADVSYVIQAVRRGDDNEIKKVLSEHILALAEKHAVGGYKIVLLFDEKDEISNWHSNRIYTAASNGEKKDILLIIQSPGGSIEPAYLISKTCIRLAAQKFVVAVPRRAKSAATLIALGANEIHMGLMSELGPIDPQFGGFPALAMRNALTLLAELSCKHPGSSEMLGKFLAEKLDLRILGYFERVNESAVQYAERLLEGKPLPSAYTPQTLSDHFVNHYKDHGFVIDADEATKLLGSKIVRQATPEYAFANEVHGSLDFIKIFMDIYGEKEFDYVGSADTGLVIRKKKAN